jgi:hypothetical protein
MISQEFHEAYTYKKGPEPEIIDGRYAFETVGVQGVARALRQHQETRLSEEQLVYSPEDQALIPKISIPEAA